MSKGSKESSMENFFNSNIDNEKGHEAIPKGEISQKKYSNYYDISNTITTAGASNPNDFDSTVYNRERIYVTNERNAEILTVKNDGVDTLYIVISHGNELSMTREVPLYPGEAKAYYNVYELRLRSPTAGTPYRVTEYSLCCEGTKTSKAINPELLAITAVAANLQQKSSTLDLTNIKQATIFIDHARDAANAFVGAGTEYRIEVSEKASGNDTWRTITSVVGDITAASSIVMDADEAAGQTLIEIGATTPAVNDIVFFKNATISLSEWGKVVAITGGTDFTLQDGLTNPQAALTIFNKAEQFVITLNTESLTRLRVIVNNNNGSTNQNIVSRIAAILMV